MYNKVGRSTILYTTTSGKIYPLEIGYTVIPSNKIQVDKKTTQQACLNGCGLYGRNGGCPPFSPHFYNVCGIETLILYARLNTSDYPARVLYGSYYTRWVFVETFLTSLTNRLGRFLANELGCYFLSSGNCHTCRPKRCALKEEKKCRNPNGRTYSLESTGVLVSDLMLEFFNIQLQWWRKDDPDYIPEFMVKVIGLTVKDHFSYPIVEEAVFNSLKKERIKFNPTVPKS